MRHKKGGPTYPNFDVRQAAFDKEGNPFIRVQRTAGGTPSGTGCNPAYACVFAFAMGRKDMKSMKKKGERKKMMIIFFHLCWAC